MLQQIAAPSRQSALHAERQNPTAGSKPDPQQHKNVGQVERIVSVAAGSVLAPLALARRGWPGLLIGTVAGGLIYRGVSGNCPAYSALKMDRNTAEPHTHGIHVEQVFLINRSPEDLYNYWRNFENLPGIMKHLKSVHVDGNRSHWITSAPRLAGGSIEWDAEITRDEPNSLIAWQSIKGSQIDCTGEIRFIKAKGDRGTEVHVYLDYTPPGGLLGHWFATIFGESPSRQMRDDLRNFKRLMECGEIVTIAGQPRGSCGRPQNGKHESA